MEDLKTLEDNHEVYLTIKEALKDIGYRCHKKNINIIFEIGLSEKIDLHSLILQNSKLLEK